MSTIIQIRSLALQLSTGYPGDGISTVIVVDTVIPTSREDGTCSCKAIARRGILESSRICFRWVLRSENDWMRDICLLFETHSHNKATLQGQTLSHILFNFLAVALFIISPFVCHKTNIFLLLPFNTSPSITSSIPSCSSKLSNSERSIATRHQRRPYSPPP